MPVIEKRSTASQGRNRRDGVKTMIGELTRNENGTVTGWVCLAMLAHFQAGFGSGRERQEGRKGNYHCLCRPLHSRSRKGPRRGERRECPRRSLPQTLYGFQCGAVRRLARRAGPRSRALARTRDHPPCGGVDRGDGRGFPHRRGQGFLFARWRFRGRAAATGLPRTDQLLPHRLSRTVPLDRPPQTAGPRPVGPVRIEALCA